MTETEDTLCAIIESQLDHLTKLQKAARAVVENGPCRVGCDFPSDCEYCTQFATDMDQLEKALGEGG